MGVVNWTNKLSRSQVSQAIQIVLTVLWIIIKKYFVPYKLAFNLSKENYALRKISGNPHPSFVSFITLF